MESRPLLLAAVLGLAAVGAPPSLAAQDRGYVSISIGTSLPYYYDRGYHHPSYFWVQGHWVSSYHGRVWIPGRYVRTNDYYDPGDYRGYGRSYYRGGYNSGYNRGYNRGHRYDPRVYYRSGPMHPRPLPGAFYYERGGDLYEQDYYRQRGRGW